MAQQNKSGLRCQLPTNPSSVQMGKVLSGGPWENGERRRRAGKVQRTNNGRAPRKMGRKAIKQASK
jgi:hypothetical protein